MEQNPFPKGQTKPNPDYIAVTIAREIPASEDANKWCKWSQYKLVGVYPACQINNKLYSLSGKRPVNNISQISNIFPINGNTCFISIQWIYDLCKNSS